MTNSTTCIAPTTDQHARLRWWICSLLFAATVINYIDRQVFSILAPELQRSIGWSELSYGRIVIAFQLSYAISLALSGRLIDRIGTRLGYTLTFIWWSFSEMAHALARTPISFGAVRLVVGVGEGAIFPSAIKTIAEWFTGRERALAAGLLNSGPTMGAILAPIIVPVVAAHYGWRGAFVLTGILGLPWLAAWLWFNRLTPREGSATALTRANQIPWRRLLSLRQTWAYAVGKLLADPAWFFYLFWLPKFLAQQHNLRGTAIIPYLTTVYLLTGLGSISGGLCSGFLLRRGMSLNASRKTTLAISACFMPVVIIAAQLTNPWAAVLLIGLVTAAHQSWSSLIFTLGTDLFPSKAMASATGIAGALGSFSTILFAEVTGRILNVNPHAYLPMFIACGFMYLVALGIIHLLSPRLEPVREEDLL